MRETNAQRKTSNGSLASIMTESVLVEVGTSPRGQRTYVALILFNYFTFTYIRLMKIHTIINYLSQPELY